MEKVLHKKTSSIDISFPSTSIHEQQDLDHDSDFEFGCLTPNSSSFDPYRNSSPADHLFFNGRLLPHSFPVVQLQHHHQPPNITPTMQLLLIDHGMMINSRGTTSRASSVSSKDYSLMSSRSNSTNSRSSVSSARTSSSSEGSSSSLINYQKATKLLGASSTSPPMASKLVMAQIYGSSQRWQHIMPIPGAALKREDSRRRNGGVLVRDHQGLKKSKKKSEKMKKRKLGFLGRFSGFFWWHVENAMQWNHLLRMMDFIRNMKLLL